MSTMVAEAIEEAWERAREEAKIMAKQEGGLGPERERPRVAGRRLSGGVGAELEADGLARLFRDVTVTEVRQHPTATRPTEQLSPLPVNLKPNET